MEYLNKIRGILLLDGPEYVNTIKNKSNSERYWWEKLYLWFHDNFEMIMIAGGSICLALLLITHMNLKDKSICSNNYKKKQLKSQYGGLLTNNDGANTNTTSTDADNGEIDLGDNTTTTQPTSLTNNISDAGTSGAGTNGASGTGVSSLPTVISKSDTILKADARIEAAKKKADNILAGRGESSKTTNQQLRSKFLTDKAEKNITKAKDTIKNIPGKTLNVITSKSSSAWKSVKSGEALELGKDKFENAISNASNFTKQNAKAGYALAFTTFMVVGFGLFFVPTLILFVIGAVTLSIFNKQKTTFLSSI